jgi:hypothetical protein
MLILARQHLKFRELACAGCSYDHCPVQMDSECGPQIQTCGRSYQALDSRRLPPKFL